MAPPLCGARPLARHLAGRGYSAGVRCLPSRLDPSESSFEDEQTVYLNAKLFEKHKSMTGWNRAACDNAFSFFLDYPGSPADWSKSLAAPVLLALQQQQPWFRKDPQFVFTLRYWKANIWEIHKNCPCGVFLSRYPLDWVASIMYRCDEGIWPHIPKDVDYLTGLWTDYMEHMLRVLENPACAERSIVLTLDQLCLPEWQEKVSRHLRLPTLDMPGLQASKIRRQGRRDRSLLSRPVRQLWERWQWLALRSGKESV